MNNLQNIVPPGFSSIESLIMTGGVSILSILLLLLVVMIISIVLIFKKAGREWWEAIVPIYNMYVWTIIIGKPWWVLFGFFVPVVNWGVSIYMNYHLSKRFGYDIPFTLGLIVLPFIFLPILAFGSSVYTAPTVQEVV